MDDVMIDLIVRGQNANLVLTHCYDPRMIPSTGDIIKMSIKGEIIRVRVVEREWYGGKPYLTIVPCKAWSEQMLLDLGFQVER